MVIIWLMMVNNNLVGRIPTPLKNDGVKVSWGDFPFPINGGKVIPSIPWFQSPPTRTNFPGGFKLAMFDFQWPCLITQLGSS